jgi:alpha-mannosidase
LIGIIDSALRKLDIRDLAFPIALPAVRRHDPSGSAFYATVSAALSEIRKSFAGLPRIDQSDTCVSVIGYSHIDSCWLWAFSQTHFKLRNTAASMLDLLKHSPIKGHFLSIAAQHYKWLERIVRNFSTASGTPLWTVPGNRTGRAGSSPIRLCRAGNRWFGN